MKILVDENNVVQIAGNYNFVMNEDNVEVQVSGKTLRIISDLNIYNCQEFEVEGEIPERVVGQYQYVNGAFVKNPQYVPDSNVKLMEYLQIHDNYLPREGNSPTNLEQIAKVVDWLKAVATSDKSWIQPSNDVVEGLNYLHYADESLSPEQQDRKKRAHNYLKKIEARIKIDRQVGDLYDLLADIDKKLGIVTGLLVRLYRATINGVPIPDAIKQNYDAFTEIFALSVDTGTYRDRSDVENPEELIPTLMQRDIKKTEILEEYKNSLL